MVLTNSSLDAIMNAVREQAPEGSIVDPLDPELYLIFDSSLKLAVDQVGRGADPDEFRDHAVINFILQADEQGFSVNVIREFLKRVSDSEG